MNAQLLTSTPPIAEVIDELRAGVRGEVLAADDERYEAARGVVYGGIDLHPGAIVRVADAADVAAVVDIARRTGLELAVRSGGHSVAGHSSTEGGIVIDVRALRDFELDVEARTAWVGAGFSAGDLTNRLTPHGLAIGFGDTGSVGVSGITLGGGIGYLVRKHGLTIDSVLGAEIVTADGAVRVVDAEHEPDLFWAIRGGGGNFGVVTRLRFRLHELPGIVGGLFVLPATPETIAGFVAAAEAAPDDLSTIANVMNCPPVPFVAEEHHGAIVILGMLVWAGDPAGADAALAPFRALGEPLADLIHPSPYAEVYPPEDESYHPKAVSVTMFVNRIGREEATTVVDRLAASDASLRAVQIRVLGGQMARVPTDATAFAHRSSRILVNVAAFYEGEADRPARQSWVDEVAADLLQDDTGAYVNFLSAEGEARVRAAYPGGTWDRLAAIKAIHDPENLFRRNQNVPPATDASPAVSDAARLADG